jgi:hypothetical protein
MALSIALRLADPPWAGLLWVVLAVGASGAACLVCFWYVPFRDFSSRVAFYIPLAGANALAGAIMALDVSLRGAADQKGAAAAVGLICAALTAVLFVLCMPLDLVLRRYRTFVEDGACPKCGYDLTGNLSGVCPECGRAIDRESAP